MFLNVLLSLSKHLARFVELSTATKRARCFDKLSRTFKNDFLNNFNV